MSVYDLLPGEAIGFTASNGPTRHGLLPATREDYPVIRAYAARTRVDETSGGAVS